MHCDDKLAFWKSVHITFQLQELHVTTPQSIHIGDLPGLASLKEFFLILMISASKYEILFSRISVLFLNASGWK